MKKLFVHQPFFRIISPIFSGILVYLLILLLNNNVAQLKEQFLGEDLYVCIGLSYLIQEASRFLLLIFKRARKKKKIGLNLFIQIIISLAFCIGIVSISIVLYYEYAVGYSADATDVMMFNSIFSFITLIYILLFVSHEYLHKVNSEQMLQEELMKENIEHDFLQFKRGINPHLLFESFDALIILMNESPEKADEFIDHLSTIYRYILSSKDKQLIDVDEELQNLAELESLFNKLPYRRLNIQKAIKTSFFVVPGSFLFLMELIIRNTISSSNIPLEIKIEEKEEGVYITYKTHDRVISKLLNSEFDEIKRVYSIYHDEKITVKEREGVRVIFIPKLIAKS